MTQRQVAKLVPGIYRLFWRASEGGGSSLAAVGCLAQTGRRWMAPVNWINFGTNHQQNWAAVERAECLLAELCAQPSTNGAEVGQ